MVRGYEAVGTATMAGTETECAFCGLVMAASPPRQVFCEDCRVPHPACPACAEELTSVEG